MFNIPLTKEQRAEQQKQQLEQGAQQGQAKAQQHKQAALASPRQASWDSSSPAAALLSLSAPVDASAVPGMALYWHPRSISSSSCSTQVISRHSHL